jgi:hypothetical protein
MSTQLLRLTAFAAILVSTACTSDRASAPTAPSMTGASASAGASASVSASASTVTAPVLASIVVIPLTVPAGSPATGTVTLTNPAPAGGVVIQLFSNLPLTATVPASVTAPAGARTVSFPIATFVGFPNTTTTPRIEAGVPGELVATGVNVVTGAPTTPPALAITPPVLNPASVVGGNTAQGTISLNRAAPAGGAFVTLQSTNTAVATTPASVTIPAGSQSATFSITTVVVASVSLANIAAGFNGGFLATTLSVTPPVTGPLGTPSLVSPSASSQFTPGTNITFDWSDVAGTASYTIQIDDNDQFPTPLVVTQTVTASQFSTATLPKRTMWWRVRAVSANGTAGGWSSIRRFEIK